MIDRGGDTLLVGGVQREGNILADAFALRAVFVRPSYHVALEGESLLHHAHPALVAAGMPALGVKRP